MFHDHWNLVLAQEVDKSVALQGPAHEIVDTSYLFLTQNILFRTKFIDDLEWPISNAWVELKFPFGLVCVLLMRLFRESGLRIQLG